MAEALALFGGGAAALSFVKDLCDISVSLYNCCKTLRYARKEIRDVANETDIFLGLLLEFCGIADSEVFYIQYQYEGVLILILNRKLILKEY